MSTPRSSADDRNLFAREWDVPRHAYVLPLLLSAVILGLWISPPIGYPTNWMLSRSSLAQGQMLPLVLHMVAHGGWAHVLTNVAVLIVISAPLVSRLGSPPLAWARYLYLFAGSGLSGAALFLSLNPGSAAMLGASGAIFGLVGGLARVHPVTGERVEIRSARSWLLIKFFLLNHLILFGVIAAAAFLSGYAIGLAWEAHLGGLLFGYFACPLFLPERALDRGKRATPES